MKRFLIAVSCLASLNTGCTVIGATAGATLGEHRANGAMKGALLGALVDVAAILVVTSIATTVHPEKPPMPTCLVYCPSNQD